MTEMDLKRIREELQKLTTLMAEWEARAGIPAIERELALAKLRGLYDAVRFADQIDAVPEPQAEQEAPEADIELEGMIFLEDEVAPAVDEVTPASEPEPVSEPEGQPEPELEDAPEVVAYADPETEPDMQTEVFAMEDTASVPDVQPEESEEVEAPVEVVAETVPEPEFDSVSGSSVGAAAEPEPQYAPGNLFGAELEADSHRRKQRVIMSLYGSEQEEKPRPAVMQAPQVEVEPVVVKEPEVLEVFGDEEPADELEEIRTEYPQVGQTPELVEISESAAEAAHPTVLGEVMNHDMRTLADTFSPRRDTLSEAMSHSSVTDLSAALGLNDRFLLARDLFEGNMPACNAALEALNAYDNLDDCMIHIAENYSWNPDSDGAKLLMDLLERKYA